MGRIVRLLNLPCPCDFVDVTCSIFFALAAGSATCPDYVFGDGYSLVPLGDLEIFITREGHLPKISSERAVGNRKLESQKLSWYQAESDKKTVPVRE